MIEGSTLQPGGESAREVFEAALDWWREAGVDYAFDDEPHGWLSAPEPEVAAPAPRPAPPPSPPRRSPIERALETPQNNAPIGGPRAAWPQALPEFANWWLTEPSLTEASSARRLPPRGSHGARLVVLVDQPADDDGDALLSGNHGKLLTAMLRAMAIPDSEVYFASALPAPAALPEWDALAARGLAEVTRHHIALAAPERVLVLGRELAPLFGISAEGAREPATLDAGGKPIPVLLAADLAQLARTPIRRRNFWTRWLEWTR